MKFTFLKHLIFGFFALLIFTASNTPVFGQARWTFMIYLDGDNNLEPYAISDFLEIATVGSNANVNFVIQMDRIDFEDSSYGDWTGCKRFYVTKDLTPTAQNAIDDLGEINMGDPEEFIKFYNWTVNRYPADNYAIILWDHGDGWSKKKGGRRKQTWKGVCFDDSNSEDGLEMKELKNAINSLTIKPKLIGFDACLMAMLENAYVLKDTGIEVMVGSEELEPGDGWPYHTISEGLVNNPEWTPKQLGTWIVDKYYESYDMDETQSAVDLTKINALSQSFDQFASLLKVSWSNISELKDPAKEVMSRIKDCVIHTKNGDNYRGAEGLAIYFPYSEYDYDSSYDNTDLAQDTSWDEFLSEFYNSMSGSLIEIIRSKSVEFDGGWNYDHIDLYSFCEILSNENNESAVQYQVNETEYNFVDIQNTGTKEEISDDSKVRINPTDFSFTYYDEVYSSFLVSDNGVVYFNSSGSVESSNESIPRCTAWGESFISPFWDDFNGANIFWEVKNEDGVKQLIIQWHEAYHYDSTPDNHVTFQVILYENNQIKFQYKDTNFGNNDWNYGGSATVGIQGSLQNGLLYSYNNAKIMNQTALLLSRITDDECHYQISSNQKEFSYIGGEATIQLATGDECEWVSTSDVNWIILLEGKTGVGSGQVKYQVNQNSSFDKRTGTIKIADKTFTVIQNSSCTFKISPLEKQFDSSGGTGVVSVKTSGPSCNWSSKVNNSWINITSGSFGTGDGKVWYSVDNNATMSDRSGTIEIADQVFKITQEKSQHEIIEIDNNAVIKDINVELGSSQIYKITIPSGTTRFVVSTEGGTGDCDLYMMLGQAPSAILDLYDYSSDSYGNEESIHLSDPTPGEWYIMLYSYETFRNVILNANYSDFVCSYTLSSTEASFYYSGGNGSFQIQALDTCNWTLSSENEWIELTSEISGFGNANVSYHVNKNNYISERTGLIYVNDQIFTVHQGGNFPEITILNNNSALHDLSGDYESVKYYKITVPPGQEELTFETWNGSGDCDLFMKYGEPPTLDDYDAASENYANDEIISIQEPLEGDYFLVLFAYETYDDVSLKVSYRDMICEYLLSETELFIESDGGYINIDVLTGESCPWEIINQHDWININSGSSGIGNGSVSLSIQPNEFLEERLGIIEIAEQLVFINQESSIDIIPLENNIPVDNLSAYDGEYIYFSIEVPDGQKNLILDCYGGEGNIDLYIRYELLPTSDDYDYSSYAWGNYENWHIKNPESGTWYIMLKSFDDSSDFSMKAQYNDYDCNYTVSPTTEIYSVLGGPGALSVEVGEMCAWTAIEHGQWIDIVESERRGMGNGTIGYMIPKNENDWMRVNNIRVANEWVTIIQQGIVQTETIEMENDTTITVDGENESSFLYVIDVPPGQESLLFDLSGGTGDCDMYIRYGDYASFMQYDYRPFKSSNNEQVLVENPMPGRWYIMLYGYSSYADASFHIEHVAQICNYIISPTEILVGKYGSQGIIQVQVEEDCMWYPKTHDDWILLSVDQAQGQGGLEYIIVENNDYNERIGKIFIGNIIITVIQQGMANVSELENNTEIDGLQSAYGDSLFYKIEVPPDQKNLIVDIKGGTGDADLYVNYMSMPTDEEYDHRCYAWGNDEYVYIKNPQAGTYFVLIYGYDQFSGVSIKAEYNQLACNYKLSPMSVNIPQSGSESVSRNNFNYLNVDVEDGCSWTAVKHGTWIEIYEPSRRGNGSGIIAYSIPQNSDSGIRANNIRIADQWATVVQDGTIQTSPEQIQLGEKLTLDPLYEYTYYEFELNEAKSLQVETWGGSGDCDILLRHSILPTIRKYDYDAQSSNNNELIEVPIASTGKWYLMLFGNYEDLNLQISTDQINDLDQIISVFQILTGLVSYDSFTLSIMDIDQDGVIGLRDGVFMLKHFAESIGMTKRMSILNQIQLKHNDKQLR